MNTEWTYLGHEKNLFNILKELGHSQNKIKLFFSKTELNKNFKAKNKINIPLDLVNGGMISPVYSGPNIDVLYNDENFLVLDKPFGIHGHPLLYSENSTCLNFIRASKDAELLKIIQIDKLKTERGLLYRLDQDTSGVLVFCKNQEMHTYLRSEFQSVVKEKIYGALVHGHCVLDTVSSWIYYKESDNRKAHSVVTPSQIPKDKKGQKAKIEIIHSNYLAKHDLSFVLVKLEEGLRHQIRVQLAMIGHSILGDSLYGGAKAPRIFLHAHRYLIESQGISKKFISNSFPLFDKYFPEIINFSDDV